MHTRYLTPVQPTILFASTLCINTVVSPNCPQYHNSHLLLHTTTVKFAMSNSNYDPLKTSAEPQLNTENATTGVTGNSDTCTDQSSDISLEAQAALNGATGNDTSSEEQTASNGATGTESEAASDSSESWNDQSTLQKLGHALFPTKGQQVDDTSEGLENKLQDVAGSVADRTGEAKDAAADKVQEVTNTGSDEN